MGVRAVSGSQVRADDGGEVGSARAPHGRGWKVEGRGERAADDVVRDASGDALVPGEAHWIGETFSEVAGQCFDGLRRLWHRRFLPGPSITPVDRLRICIYSSVVPIDRSCVVRIDLGAGEEACLQARDVDAERGRDRVHVEHTLNRTEPEHEARSDGSHAHGA